MTATRADVLLLHAARRPAGDAPPAWHDRVLQALPYAKRLEVERRTAEARAASLDALALLCVGLDAVGEVASRLRELRYDEHGAPRLAGGRGFSLAHCASRVACVVADSPPSVALGLDLEDFEAATTSDPVRQARLRDWVMTEAVLKAAGRGLRESANVVLEGEQVGGPAEPAAATCRFATLEGWRYRAVALPLGAGSLCAVACLAPMQAWPRIERIEIDSPRVSAAVERRLGLPP